MDYWPTYFRTKRVTVRFTGDHKTARSSDQLVFDEENHVRNLRCSQIGMNYLPITFGNVNHVLDSPALPNRHGVRPRSFRRDKSRLDSPVL